MRTFKLSRHLSLTPSFPFSLPFPLIYSHIPTPSCVFFQVVDTFSMPNTIYQPIYTHKYQTRILTILPSWNPSSQVECILRPVSLLDNISYQALSYTWGINDTIPLLVNGINFPVRTNLASALKHIRESNKEVTL